MRLDQFSNSEFFRGASRFKEIVWLTVSGILVESWLPGSAWRRWLLRAFGAKVGNGVVIKPRVRVKFPWRLSVGDHSWIGEQVWIDNLAEVSIGSHCCISQGAYFCTGSHDCGDPKFGLIAKPIVVCNSCWICAQTVLAPGAVLEEGAVLSVLAVAKGRLLSNMIYRADGTKTRKEIKK